MVGAVGLRNSWGKYYEIKIIYCGEFTDIYKLNATNTRVGRVTRGVARYYNFRHWSRAEFPVLVYLSVLFTNLWIFCFALFFPLSVLGLIDRFLPLRPCLGWLSCLFVRFAPFFFITEIPPISSSIWWNVFACWPIPEGIFTVGCLSQVIVMGGVVIV